MHPYINGQNFEWCVYKYTRTLGRTMAVKGHGGLWKCHGYLMNSNHL